MTKITSYSDKKYLWIIQSVHQIWWKSINGFRLLSEIGSDLTKNFYSEFIKILWLSNQSQDNSIIKGVNDFNGHFSYTTHKNGQRNDILFNTVSYQRSTNENSHNTRFSFVTVFFPLCNFFKVSLCDSMYQNFVLYYFSKNILLCVCSTVRGWMLRPFTNVAFTDIAGMNMLL